MFLIFIYASQSKFENFCSFLFVAMPQNCTGGSTQLFSNDIDLNVLSLSGFSKKFAGSAVLLFYMKSQRRNCGRRPGARVAADLKIHHSLAVVSVFIGQVKRGLGCSLSLTISGSVIIASRDKYIQLLLQFLNHRSLKSLGSIQYAPNLKDKYKYAILR